MNLLNQHLSKREQIIPFLSSTFKKSQKNALNEQAVPSYLHSSFLVRETFWLRIVQAHAQAKTGERVLDFGSGLGAMLPWHLKSYRETHLYDSHPMVMQHLEELKKNEPYTDLKLHMTLQSLKELPENYFDTIFALDVLEHVDNLPDVLVELKRLLKPKGKLVVSSPTENWIYKFSRNFGGEGYKGEYHIRAAKEVEEDLQRFFKVKLKARVYPIFTFAKCLGKYSFCSLFFDAFGQSFFLVLLSKPNSPEQFGEQIIKSALAGN